MASGAAVWAGTLVGGMLLRALTGGGVQVSFVIVAGVVLAVFLLGWRLVTRTRSASARRSSIGRSAPLTFGGTMSEGTLFRLATSDDDVSSPGATACENGS